MTSSNGVKIIYGAGGIAHAYVGLPEGFRTFHEYSKQALETLKEENISTLDTAEIYPGSEEEIAFHHGTEHFTVDTKIRGGFGDARKGDEIIAAGRARLEALKTKQVHILYIHAPETAVPFEEQLSALNVLYKEGAFQRLGLSNFTAEQVQEVYDISKKNGYALPTVYQGSYAAVSRVSEAALIPKLRELGISYYAYSPIAGGFLAKTRQQVEDGVGRFDSSTSIGRLYITLYRKPSYLAVLEKWGKIAEDAGISKAELAYRWVTYHSALDGEKGDGIIFGARSTSQIKETIGYIKAGPLPGDIAQRVNELWEDVKDEAPVDNFHK